MKIIESFNIDDLEIYTDEGWKDITSIHKTVSYEVYEVFTNSFNFKGADHHKVYNENMEPVSIKDLLVHDKIQTINGLETVISIVKTNEHENMYSPTVADNHRYYGNNILHKNTTIVGIYALHYALFNKSKTIAVLANKMQGAIEIVDRIKTLLEGLPEFLRPGIKEYNKKTIIFENGCKIMAAATSPSAVRGLAINCLTGENEVTVLDTETDEEMTLPIELLAILMKNDQETTYGRIEE
jgi:hypothetical protein